MMMSLMKTLDLLGREKLVVERERSRGQCEPMPRARTRAIGSQRHSAAAQIGQMLPRGPFFWWSR